MKSDRSTIHRVKLRFAMKQLDRRLKAGSTGYTNPEIFIKESPVKGRYAGEFVWVAFDNGAHEPILWGCLLRQNYFGDWDE